jgi:hypothetical protein
MGNGTNTIVQGIIVPPYKVGKERERERGEKRGREGGQVEEIYSQNAISAIAPLKKFSRPILV